MLMFVKLDRHLCCVNVGPYKWPHTKGDSCKSSNLLRMHTCGQTHTKSHVCVPLNSLSNCNRETDTSPAATCWNESCEGFFFPCGGHQSMKTIWNVVNMVFAIAHSVHVIKQLRRWILPVFLLAVVISLTVSLKDPFHIWSDPVYDTIRSGCGSW